ncbi:uncharacterized protein LOC123530319 [Mercenaria mercenaria]|uniref:uncharacterized protein LOC123530319 n=1 Tax=Mercenaria mercenaria TaxID=6596 RepID=UPI00234F9F97|nr:uncharacterized protein LOC123530319 [Mercenaria mercenaria]
MECFIKLPGVRNEAMCYNAYYDEVKQCSYGCCGTDLDVECCLPSRLAAIAAAVISFFVILTAVVVVICYRKQRALKRILDTGSRPSITNDRNLHHATMVNLNPPRWTPCKHRIAPPPYIEAPPPYTAVNVDNFKQTSENLQLCQSAPPSYINSNVQHGCISPNPRTSQQYHEPPPQYGVYADLAHNLEQRT